MKKLGSILVFLVSISMLAAAPFSTSLLYDASFGNFWTQIDSAGSAGQGFLDLEGNYVFGGLTNLNKTQVISSTPPPGPLNLTLGTYIDAERPWSLYASLYNNPTPATSGGKEKMETFSTKTVGSTTHHWVDLDGQIKYFGRLADNTNNTFQYLTLLDDMIVGGKLNISTVNNSLFGWPNNYKGEMSVYYDAAAATAAPDPKLDYTIEEESRNFDKEFDFSLSSPIFVPGEKTDQTMNAAIGFGSENRNQRLTTTYSTPNNSTGNLEDVLHDDVTDKEGYFSISGMYKLDTESPFIDSTSKDFYYGGSLAINIKTAKYGTEVEKQDYSYTLSGSTMNKTKAKYTYNSVDRSLGGALDLNIQGMAGHRFSYDLGSGLHVIMTPEAQVGLRLENEVKLKQVETTSKNDTDNDGDVETTTVTTTEYFNTNSTFSDKSRSTFINMDLNPTCALQYQPEGWKLGLTYGAKVELGMQVEFQKSKPSYSETTTETTSGGTTTTTTSKTSPTTATSSRTIITWSSLLEHNFAMHFDLSEQARILADVSLTAGGGILDLKNFTIQSIIALP
jgi:hypothetical protein